MNKPDYWILMTFAHPYDQDECIESEVLGLFTSEEAAIIFARSLELERGSSGKFLDFNYRFVNVKLEG